MKYLFFVTAVLGIIPLTIFMVCYRRFIRWGVLGLILPLCIFNATSINFFSHETYRGTSRGVEISLVYIVAASLLLAFFILRGHRRICPDRGSRLYSIYFLLCIPSALNAPNLLIFSFELWKMAMIHLVFMAVYYYLEFYDGDIDIIFYGVAMLVAWNTLSVLREYLLGVYRVRGIFPHPNSMAMYMATVGVLFFSRSFNRAEGKKTLIFIAGFILASVTLVRSYSRGALLCYPIGAFLTMICSLWNGRSPHKTRYFLFLLPVILAGALLAIPKIVDRFEKAPKASAKTRKQFVKAAVKMMKDKTWCGVGLNNWSILISPPYHYTEHRDQTSIIRDDDNAVVETVYQDDFGGGIVETIYLLVGAECGIPCLLALLAWFGYYWVSSIRLMKLLRGTEYFYLPAGFFGALTAIFLQSALEWVLKQQINFIWLVTMFAIISFLNKHYDDLIKLDKKMRNAGGAPEADASPDDGGSMAAASGEK
ncbi:MAG: O-antigen ligase family protein [Lentisphaeria bacterium]|nr:O-antigen ligase family protein [Lentisphaeria bacterium]